MMAAPTGDDVYGEDPTVGRLQDVLAERLVMRPGCSVRRGPWPTRWPLTSTPSRAMRWSVTG